VSDTVTVIGIDPSLARTGLARIVVDRNDPCGMFGSAESAVRPSTGHRGDSLDQRRDRLNGIARDVIDWCAPADLAVIEGPSYGSAVSAAAWDRAGLWWLIVTRLNRRGIAVAVVPPSSRAKWATGNGLAGKAAVLAAIGRLWSAQGWTGNHTDHNEGDALVLASMGAQWLRALPVLDQPPRALLGRCEWPYWETT
jgi:Holliday junction resolvasome RuvABC endonuclease subunit